MEGSMTGRRRRWARFLGRAALTAGVFALALTAATCGGDDDDSSGHPTTTESPQAAVKADYLAFWDMAVRLAEAPDPADPELTKRASGDALDDLVKGLTTLKAADQHSVFGPRYTHDVLSVQINGKKATVEDCAVDDSKIVDASTGEVVDQSVVTERLEVELVQSDNNSWLVNSSSRKDAREGAVACD
jgi:hypothetical protein